MSGGEPGGSERTISVEPPVHVETIPSHDTLTWKACPLAQFLGHVVESDGIPPTASTLVDDTSTGGRERYRVADLEASETVRYLRVEPDAPWQLSWERRTWPVVSVSGTPPATLCRRLHVRTTDCDGWPDDAVRTLAGLLSDR
jgi:hypothetical protein